MASRVRDRFDHLCSLVELPRVGLRRGRATEFPAPRDHMYCRRGERGGLTIVYAPKCETTSTARIDGLLMHELGHAIALAEGWDDHTERDADALARAAFGRRVHYDAGDVQTTGRGRKLRPRHLPA